MSTQPAARQERHVSPPPLKPTPPILRPRLTARAARIRPCEGDGHRAREKIAEACGNKPWGASSTMLSEIAQSTYDYAATPPPAHPQTSIARPTFVAHPTSDYRLRPPLPIPHAPSHPPPPRLPLPCVPLGAQPGISRRDGQCVEACRRVGEGWRVVYKVRTSNARGGGARPRTASSHPLTSARRPSPSSSTSFATARALRRRRS